jgi:hypothetical protein
VEHGAIQPEGVPLCIWHWEKVSSFDPKQKDKKGLGALELQWRKGEDSCAGRIPDMHVRL